MFISKTDYLEYTFCRKNLWLKKHKPKLFENVELSDFEKKIIEEGNLADEEARHLFPSGVLVDSFGQDAINDTKQYKDKKQEIIFQATFAEDVFFIRADILIYDKNNDGYELYEVKASNGVKREKYHNHIKDLAFQKCVIEKSGLKVIKIGVIHLNGEYQRQNNIDYNKLFVIEDISNEVDECVEDVKIEMTQMKNDLQITTEPKGCECIYRGRSNQCTTFSHSNPEIPEYSVHDLNRIGASKKVLYDWIDRGIYAIEDIDNIEVLTGAKKAQYEAYTTGKPIIDQIAIKKALDELVFPLYFFDYEGFVSAIPMFDNFGAYEQIPFQYSLHTMQEDGSLDHKEFIIENPKGDLTRPLLEQIVKDIDPNGTVISWNKSYEAGRNKKLAEIHPDYANFLEKINDGMFDLMTMFSKSYYVDARFKGSASIKNVLQVLVPELTYKNLNICKGDQASERWKKMISADTHPDEKEQIKKDLLEYCKLDTLAMVRIYEFFKKQIYD